MKLDKASPILIALAGVLLLISSILFFIQQGNVQQEALWSILGILFSLILLFSAYKVFRSEDNGRSKWTAITILVSLFTYGIAWFMALSRVFQFAEPIPASSLPSTIGYCAAILAFMGGVLGAIKGIGVEGKQISQMPNTKQKTPLIGVGIIVVIIVITYLLLQTKQASVSSVINSSITHTVNKTGPFLTQTQIRSMVPQYNSSSVSFDEQYIPSQNLSNYTLWLMPIRQNVTGEYFLLSSGDGGLILAEGVFLLNNTYIYNGSQLGFVCSEFTSFFAQEFNQTGSGPYVNGQFVNNSYHYYIKSIVSSNGIINGMSYTYSVLVPSSNSSITNATVLCGYKNGKFALFDTSITNVSSFSSVNPRINRALLMNYISNDLT